MTDDPSLARQALAAVALPVALFIAVVAQLTVVNRLPLPGGDAPDLVLLLVAAVAVNAGTLTGTLTGFVGGLALDVAPPATHYVGEYALIFCVVGYAAGRMQSAIIRASGERDPVITLAVMTGSVAAGEAGKAGLGRLLSDPNVTNAAITHVLPGAVCYDLLLSPLALWLVGRVATGARPLPAQAPAPQFDYAQRLASAFRSAGTGAAPDLRLVGTGAVYQSPSPARRELRLRLSGARSPALDRTVPGSSPTAQPLVAGGRAAKLNFAANGPARARARQAARPGKNWLRDAGRPRPAQQARLGGAALSAAALSGSSRSAATPSRSASQGAARTLGRGWLRAAGSAGLVRAGGGTFTRRRPLSAGWLHSARSAPQWTASSTARSKLVKSGLGNASSGRPGTGPGKSAFNGSGIIGSINARSGRKAPGGPGKSAFNGSGIIGSINAKSGRKATPGRGWIRPSRHPKPNWYTSGPTGKWLRRSRSRGGATWRRRMPRLMRRVGGSS